MSTIVKTEAVVLRAIKYRETSKIVTFYTRQFGRISAIVKGARQAKNKYGASLEPMSYVCIVLYKKEGREIQTISQCDLMKSFRHLSEDLNVMAVGMSMIELVNNVCHEQEQNIPLFTLLVHSLDALNSATKYPLNVLYYFEIHLARVLGFQLSFGNCISCSRKILKSTNENQTIRFHLGKGGLLCADCAAVVSIKETLSMKVVQILDAISNSKDNLSHVSEIEIDTKESTEINNLLWTYLRYHVSGIRISRSNGVFRKVLV